MLDECFGLFSPIEEALATQKCCAQEGRLGFGYFVVSFESRFIVDGRMLSHVYIPSVPDVQARGFMERFMKMMS